MPKATTAECYRYGFHYVDSLQQREPDSVKGSDPEPKKGGATICRSQLPYVWTNGSNSLTFTEPGSQTITDPIEGQQVITINLYPEPAQPYISMEHFNCLEMTGYLEGPSAIGPPPILNYSWKLNGTEVSTSQIYYPTTEGKYTLTVEDGFHCVYADTQIIRYSFNPIYDLELTTELCAGDSYPISMGYGEGYSIQLGNRATSLAVNDTIFLPDGIICDSTVGCSYRSPVTFTDFAPNATVSSVEDILFVRLKIEHSYSGDLYINITCPNSQKADILKYGGSGSSSCSSSINTSSRGWQSGSNASGSTDFGVAERTNDNSSNKCSTTDNPQGIGWNYCWSNNTTEGYIYADSSLIYRSVNAHNNSFDSTNVAEMSQVYHPDQSFESLVGCPLNGTWYIEVIDGWGGDNGYIYGWELALQSHLMPQEQPAVVGMHIDGPWATDLTDSTGVISVPSTLAADTNATYTFMIFQEDGCSFDTTATIHIHAPVITVYEDTTCQGQAYSGYGFTVPASETSTSEFIIKKERRDLSPDNPEGCGDTAVLHLHVLPGSITTMPENGRDTVACPSAVQAPELPVVTDACGDTITPTGPSISTMPACDGSVVYTYTYTDHLGNSRIWTYTYVISRPALADSIPANRTQDITCEIDADEPVAPEVRNACGEVVSVSRPVITNTVVNGRGNVIYTYTYTDCNNNTATWTHTYHVTPAPFTPVADSSSQVHCVSEAVRPTTPTIRVCGVRIDMRQTNRIDNTINGCGTVIFIFSYQVNGTSYQWKHTYTVSPEDFTMPRDTGKTVNCFSDVRPPESNILPVVSDTCGRRLTPQGPTRDDSGYNGCEGNVTYTYTYTDCAGHSHNWVYTYRIKHPHISQSLPAPKVDTVECDYQVHIPERRIVTNACGDTADISSPRRITTSAPDGHSIITYSYTYSDCNGDTAVWTHTFHIIPASFTPISDESRSVYCEVNAIPRVPQLRVCNDLISFRLINTTSTIRNGCGNKTYTYEYTVNGVNYTWRSTFVVSPLDFTMPAPGSDTVNCISEARVAPALPRVTDYCGRHLTPTGHTVSEFPECEGDVTYTYTYEDCAHHTHNWTYTYHIVLPPLYRRIPAHGTGSALCEVDAVAPEAPVVLNICGDTASVGEVQRYSNVGDDGRGTVVYTYIYIDCNGDTASWHYTYNVEPAEFHPIADESSSIHCLSERTLPTPPVFTVCGDTIRMLYANEQDNTVNGCGSYIYTYSYTVNAVPYQWHYVYLVSPEDFTMPANDETTVACPDDARQAPALPNVTDYCGNTLNPSAPVVSSIPDCREDVTHTYTYTDCAGHHHDWVFTYHIAAPVVIVPEDGSRTVHCANEAAEPSVAPLTDACGRSMEAVADVNNPIVDMHSNGHGTVTYRYTYTDCTDSVYHWAYIYTVTPEVFEPVADADTNVFCAIEVGDPTLPIVEVCDSTILFTLDSVFSSIVDGCGDSVYVYRYTVNDTPYRWRYTWHVSPADFAGTMPANDSTTVYCLSQAVLPTASVPEVRDYCGRILEPQAPESYAVTTYDGCEGNVTYTYTFEDCAHHTHNWVYTYQIKLPPLANRIPADGTGSALCEVDALVPEAPVVLNICGDTASVGPVQRISTVGGDGRGTVTYTYTYTDCNNDTASWHYIYTVEPAEFRPVADESTDVHCLSEVVLPESPVITVCGDTVRMNYDSEQDNTVNGCGTYVYTFSYSVNEVPYQWHYTYNVSPEDFTMPDDDGTTVSCPADVTNAPTLPTVTDACGRVLTPSEPAVSSIPQCEGNVTHTYTYTDCAGHHHDWVYTYLIELPAVVVPEDGTDFVHCANEAVEPSVAPLTDACGRIINAVADENNPFVDMHSNGHGTVTYRYTYTDCTDSVYHWAYIYTVTPEAFEPVQNADTNVFCAIEVGDPALPIVEVCDSIIPFTLDSVFSSIVDGCGDSVYVYRYTVNDTPYHWRYTWHVSPDDFASTMPADDGTTVYCLAQAVQPTASVPEVRDFCGRVLEPQAPESYAVTTYDGCEGNVTYTYIFEDCAHHTHNWVYTYQIKLPPLANRIPADGTGSALCEVDALVPEAPVVLNICGDTASVGPVQRISTVGGDGRGTVTYTYTYTDCNNDTASWHFTYNIEPAEFHPVADDSTDVHCLSEVIQPESPIITVCGDTIRMQYENEQDSTVNGCGTYTYTFSYSVNEVPYQWHYTYIVSPQDFVLPANEGTTVSCPADAEQHPTLPNVTDFCDQVLTPTDSSVSSFPECEGDVTYTYTYTDCAGNNHDWTFTYHIELPAVVVPENGTDLVHCANEATEPSVAPLTDACGRSIAAVADENNPFVDMRSNGHGTVTYRYTYTDCSGSVYHWAYIYTVTPEAFEPVQDADTNVYCADEVTREPNIPEVVVCGDDIPFDLIDVSSTIKEGCGDSVFVYEYMVNDTPYFWKYTWHIRPDDFNMPSEKDTTVYCLADVKLPKTFVPEVTDYCGRILEPQVPESYVVTTYNGCEGDVTYTYSYTDCAEHQHDWVFTYHIQLPSLADRIPEDETKYVNCEVDAIEPEAPVILNVCGDTAAVDPVQRVSTVGGDGRGTVIYTYTYTECNGDTASWHYTYIVEPTEFIPIADDSTFVHCFSEVQRPTTPVIINCGDSIEVNLIDSIDNMVNGCGNFIYHYQYEVLEVTYNWHYTYWVSPEDFIIPADRDTIVTCPADVHTPVMPLVTDACGRALQAVDSIIDALPSCKGTISYRYTYEDCAEHSHVWTYTYSIQPHPLVIPADRDSVVACENQTLEPMTDTLTDDCGRVITAVADQGNPFVDMHANGHGTVTYRYTYTDCTDSVYHWTYNYIVTPEDFEPVADDGSDVFCATNVTNPVLPVVEVCDSIIPFTLDSLYGNITDGCGDSVYVYEYTVNDTLYHWTYTWHVSPDDFASTMPADDDTTVYCLAQVELPTTFVPEVRDYCGRILEPQVPESYAVTTYDGCEGDVTYTYGYTDCAGQHHDWVFTYHILLPPLAERIPADETQNISCERYALVPEAPIVMNICGDTADVSPVQRFSTVGGDGQGSVIYTYTYTDCNNDTASWHFTYIVVPEEFHPAADDSSFVHCFAEIHQPATPIIVSCGEDISVNLIDTANNVVDGCGNFIYHYQYEVFDVTYNWYYTYWVSPEDFVMPADRDTIVTCPADVHTPSLPLVSDACGRVLLPVDSVIDALPLCKGIISYRYTYRDCAEHTHVWTYTYSIQPHPLVIPADRASVVACENQTVEPMTDTLIDDCGRVITAVADQGNPFVDMHANGHGTVTYRYTYTDCTDSVYHWTYIYTVTPEDFEPVADADTNVFCAVEVVTPVLPVVEVCDSIIPFTLDSAYSSIVDGCGDSVYVYRYTVNDTLYRWTYIWHVSPADFASIMPADDDTTVYCLAHAVLPTTFVPEVKDNCERILEPQVPESFAVTTYNGCEGDVTYTYGYTDCAGHHHDWVFTYHIQLPPLAERIPTDETRNITCEIDALVPNAPVVMNVCGDTADVSPVQHVSTVGGDGRGTVTYTYTYTDCNNDTASWHFTYIVIPDEYHPVPDDSTFVHCFVEIQQPVTPVIISCGDTIAVSLVNTVNNVVDGCGNFIYHYQYEVFEVTYNWYYTYRVSPEDFVMPADRDTIVTCPADVHTPTLPLVSDACGRVLLPVDSVIDALPPCEGIISYRYTYRDCAEHTHVWTYTYSIQPHPLIIPADRASVVACENQTVEPMTDTLIDDCGRVITAVANQGNPFVDMHANGHGTVIYRYTYTDCTDSVYHWTYTYTVTPEDFEPVANADTNVFCAVEVVTPVLPVVEVCDSIIPFTLDSAYSSIVDGCGDSVYVYRYTVNDTLYHWIYIWHVTPPDFNMPDNEDTTVYCLAHAVLPTTFVPEIRDYCGRILEPQVPESLVATTYDGCEGDVTYTYGYTDCAGHHHDWVFTYHIQLPPLSERIPADETRNITCEIDALVPNAPVVMNVCGDTADVSPVQHVSTVGGDGRGTVTYTYTYTDCNNDSASWHFTYIVVPEEFHPAPDDSTFVHCFAEIHQPTTPVVVSCGEDISVNLIDTVNNVVDGCGNFIYHYQYEVFEVTYNWYYTYWVSPVDFVMPADVDTTVTCPADVHTPTLPLVSDACGRVLQPVASMIDTLPSCEGIISYRYTYEDCAGHSHVWAYTYQIERGFTPVEIGTAATETFVECISEVHHPSILPVYIDACNDTLRQIYTPEDYTITTYNGCNGDVEYTYIYQACTGDSISWTYTYHIADTTHPQYDIPAPMFLCRNIDGSITADTTVTGCPFNLYDNCTAISALHITHQDVQTNHVNVIDTITRTWYVNDFCGNMTVKTQYIYIRPVPVISLIDDREMCDDVISNCYVDEQYPFYHWSTGAGTRAISASVPGIYTVTVMDINGCYAQSEIELILYPNPIKNIHIPSICQFESSIIDMGYTSQNAIELYTGQEYVQVDSFHFIGPNVQAYGNNSYLLSAPPRMLHDTTITYTIIAYGHNGCTFDSVKSVDFHMVEYSFESDTACDRYEWHNRIYTESGFYIDTLQTIFGCDSITSLYLTVFYSTTGDTVAYACDSFTWYGETFTESTDTPTHVFVNSVGCDSTVTLHLTIYPSYLKHVPAHICEGDGYEDQDFQVSQQETIGIENLVRYRYLESIHGCDSVIRLELSITDTTMWITPSSPNFCDEFELDLTVVSSLPYYFWSTGETDNTIHVTSLGTFTVIATDGICSNSAQFTIKPCEFELYLPNTITASYPDGLNDYFCINERQQKQMLDKDFSIIIYNRTGQLIFESEDKNFKWDGKANGRVLEGNMYVYVIRCKDLNNQFHTKKGTILTL